ncbi:TolC family outer membrane protein [Photobacterium leiognathi]|uniref:Agglutination protein n=1 Tax=Photobacterium leiognathi subsp. mandapamensis TaxID=48408 RepID=A0A2T3KWR9_PHOLD|nr:TolC family outer membrane protein [Photobacterium leiognathi]MCG3885418.1 TolC family outer membrane protein [Photobacterium leiognathi]PSV04285.1 agglutination protein [Photobacterium leiognathi subsp. mandapamensis]PSV11843.1 agglutination protein [Photobacterium leiognathi subsp. mandapamensis]PSW58393.1 agglutination protein [Photobacterium leiognathi subsp. mandapamensis]
MTMKYKLKKAALLVSLQCVTAPVMAQSLEQAVAETISSNPEIKSAYNEFQSKHELINASKGDYLPSVDLEAGVGYNKYNNSNLKSETDPRSASINIRQLIWDGSITYNDIQRNKSEAEAERYQLLSDAQDKALKATEAYLNVLHAEDVLALSESNLKVHQKMYSDIKKRADSGIGSTADLAQVDGRLASSNANLLSAQSNLHDKITQFVRVVGQYPKDLVKPEVDVNYLPKSLDDALEKAKKYNPVVHMAANDVDAAEYQYKQATGTFYPSFSIEASQEWGDDLNGVEGKTDELKAMLKMRYNLFNGGSDVAKSRRAAYQINKSKDIRDRAHHMLEEGTRLSWSALDLAKNQKLFLQEHVDASARTVIAYEKQFKIGQRTLLDVLNTENELFEARKAYLTAEYDGILAKYRVLNATGLILDEMRVDIPENWAKSVK